MRGIRRFFRRLRKPIRYGERRLEEGEGYKEEQSIAMAFLLSDSQYGWISACIDMIGLNYRGMDKDR